MIPISVDYDIFLKSLESCGKKKEKTKNIEIYQNIKAGSGMYFWEIHNRLKNFSPDIQVDPQIDYINYYCCSSDENFSDEDCFAVIRAKPTQCRINLRNITFPLPENRQEDFCTNVKLDVHDQNRRGDIEIRIMASTKDITKCTVEKEILKIKSLVYDIDIDEIVNVIKIAYEKSPKGHRLKNYLSETEIIHPNEEEHPMDKYVNECVELLKCNHNLILTGAPGTGKTYLAKKIAQKMIFPDSKIDDEMNEEMKLGDQFDFVQFHPSYDYTDFVEGLRAEELNGQVTFKLRNGIFKDFCKEALEEPDFPFVFVIDEINRGEISKIFGELFFSIDPDYRGTKGKVKTQYANIQSEETIFDENEEQGWFYVPENVYIIGTMNDIDRSVESFDFAMRRRFVWKEITAEESAENMGEKIPAEAKKRMTSLNKAISGISGLGTSYQLGGAYFLPKEDEDEIEYQRLWDLRLEPLMKEYLRSMPDTEDRINDLKDAFDGKGADTSTREDSDAEND